MPVRNRRPGRPGTPPSGHYDPGARSSLYPIRPLPKRKLEAGPGERSAAPEPKIATVERREASVSRETRAPHTRPGRAAMHAPPVPEHRNVISAFRHPLIAGARSKKQNPGAKPRRGNEETCAV